MKVKSFVTAVGLTLALSLGLGTTSAMAAKVTLKQKCNICTTFNSKQVNQKRCLNLKAAEELNAKQQRMLKKCNRCSSGSRLSNRCAQEGY